MPRRFGRNGSRGTPHRSRGTREGARYPTYSYERTRPRTFDRDKVFLGPNDVSLYCDSDEDEDCTSEVIAPVFETKLHVTTVDLHIPENTKEHHTDRYACTTDRLRESDETEQKALLVIRRGQTFQLTVHFDRPYDIHKNDLVLMFNLGTNYKPNKNLNVTVKVDESGDMAFSHSKWGASLENQHENSLTLAVFVPASAPVGEWQLSIRTIVDVVDDKDLIWQYNHNEDIIIIFNPWCQEDLVYLEHEDWMNEAVLSDAGVLYYGDPNWIGARPWCYGQYEDGILEAALHLVRKGFGYEATPAMADPVNVTRILSQLVNAPDDGGVVFGNWTGEYDEGTSPTVWVGSTAILREYMSTTKPVRFGQCWVFAGVLTTVCRALGLPCRNVTCFSSAHNTDADHLSIDVINVKDANGDWNDTSNDSVWNFHVWNEAWMRRPDLSDEHLYDGWQVIDATPQERSFDGLFACGPCPVAAVKEGDITVGSDGAFIFCEVNADRVEWTMCEKTGMLLETKRTSHGIGLCISTHIPTGRAFRGETVCRPDSDSLERLDITESYKYSEGSVKEREVVRKAEMMFRRARAYMMGYTDDCVLAAREAIQIEIEQEEEIFVGNGFEFTVKMKNSGKTSRKIKQLVIKVLYKTYFDVYTGVAGTKRFKDVELGPDDETSYRICVDEEKASRRPGDGFYFEIKALAEFYDTHNVVTGRMNFRLRRPDIQIKGPQSCRRYGKFTLDVTFTNPLKVTLTNCQVNIEGGLKCLQPAHDKFLIPNIGPGMTWSETLTVEPKLHPRDKDERDITIGFHSKQLSDIRGHFVIDLDW